MTYRIQIGDVIREATIEEAAAIDAIRSEAEVTSLTQVQALRKSAKEKLAALGLSEAEIAALIGA